MTVYVYVPYGTAPESLNAVVEAIEEVVTNDCNFNGADIGVRRGDHLEMLDSDGEEVTDDDYVRLFYKIQGILQDEHA